MLRFVWIFFIVLYSFEINPDYKDWSQSEPIRFSDFKGTPPPGNKSKVNISTVITFQTRQIKGEVPEITIYNRMDRNASWISLKKEEVLRIQQIHFNTSELYARKIRKEIENMNAAKIIQKEKYSEMIRIQTEKLHKIQKSRKILLEDQPHLIKIREKEILDSLNLYKDYKN